MGFWLSFTVSAPTKCVESRQRLLRSPQRSGRYIPKCDQGGSYERVQCHSASGYCWCVGRNGMEWPGTRQRGGRPACEDTCKIRGFQNDTQLCLVRLLRIAPIGMNIVYEEKGNK